MATIIQLSDVHLTAYADQERETIEPLIEALALVRASSPTAPDLLVLTGDVFDTSTLDPHTAFATYQRFHKGVERALGKDIATVILPGNHDRRSLGLLGPHRGALFEALRDGLGDKAWVSGCRTPFLADVVPASFHKLPFPVVTYDSTYLPTGLVSAGGMMRQADLLQVADQIADEPGDRPLLVLTHHHLIPTPLTDLARVDVNTESRLARWLVKNIVARLISNADREEWMMTALGSGTALSTLHTLDRAVLVLHGHKHYPTVRALRSTLRDQGDLLVVAAGSAGVILTWNATDDPAVAHLWPSFNVVTIEDGLTSVEAIAFSPRRKGATAVSSPTRIARRTLVRAGYEKAQWRIDAVGTNTVHPGPVVNSNRANYRLVPSINRPGSRWDVECERSVQALPGSNLTEYVDVEEGASGARLVDIRSHGAALPDQNAPATLRLRVDGTKTTYRLLGGVSRTLTDAAAAYNEVTAFEWVDLLNRYESDVATLVLEGLPANHGRPFGSAVDLTNGQERPVRVAHEPGRAVLTYANCPPRTLLRILWPIES